MELTLSLDNQNRLYYAGDYISGSLLAINKIRINSSFKVLIKVIGYYTFSNSKINPPKAKQVQFYKKGIAISNDFSSMGANNTYRFKFPLNSDSCGENYANLYESYRGASVSVNYDIYAETTIEGKQYYSKKEKILVMVPGQGINSKFGRKRVSYQFSLNPDKIELKNVEPNLMPKFQVECFLENINCCIDKPFNGFCNIKECSTQIKSIELQFIRNEQVLHPEFKGLSEVSEIQNLQIGDGDVIRDLEIPIFMIFPRHFCCANLDTKDASISFSMNLIIVLVNGVVIMENYPVNLWRGG